MLSRFLAKPDTIGKNVIRLDEQSSTKIRKVLRKEIGDEIEVIDGEGMLYLCELILVTNKECKAQIIESSYIDKTSNITLIQALPSNLKIDFILQKNTELGIDKMIFFESEYSRVDVSKMSKEKVERWKKISSSAVEQSRRIYLPEINLHRDSFESLVEIYSKENSCFYLDFNGVYLNKIENIDINNISFFIGTEGGFSKKEKELFEKYNIKKVKLSENVLRAETASMAMLSQIQLLRSI